MAKLIELKTYSDNRGSLSVLETPEIPFEIKRIFYIYEVDDSDRGGHRHHKTVQAAICIKGSCVVENDDNEKQENFILDDPKKCLILYPNDWHVLKKFSKDAILLVLASEFFDEADYIFEPYR
ncbi:MAG: FdtA/QdtA family cupin domain-containing protein [Bacteroidetes bacterium]|nr:FdtA/QdtA family cupin domain-containing protein [Bacteroidota bacterium]